MTLDKPAKPLLTYGTYPTLALITGVALWAALRLNLGRNAVIGVLTLVTIAIVFAVERLNPLMDRAVLGHALPDLRAPAAPDP